MAVQEGMYMTFENKQSIYDAINKLRIQNDALILAHLYENLDIQNIADFCGVSFELAKKAKDSERKNIIFCGVKFMAESAKILNPDKHVFIPRKDAGCAMADMVTPDDVRKLKEAHPNACAVCYINSSAATKAECDMCVTSSNALDIISALPQKEIIFVPDKNLGAYIAEKLPEKVFYIHSGYCPVHKNISADALIEAKKNHPDALVLVHPECEKEVVELSDFAGSTSAIIKYAHSSSSKSFIIGTERAVCERLIEECPDKNFYLLSETLVCEDMKKTTLLDLYSAIQTRSDEVIRDDEVMKRSSKCLEGMLKAGSVKK